MTKNLKTMTINLKTLSDEEVVKLVISEDKNHYKELVFRYQDKLLRYAKYFIPDENAALDAVQEAFIKAYVNLKGFKPSLKFSSWIYRITHNEAINVIKKYKRQTSLEKNGWINNIKDKKANLEKNYEKKELKKLIQDSLNELPFKYKDVLVLFFLEEKSYQEISDILKIPIGTVGTHINRGKKLMKEKIEAGGHYEKI